MSDFDTLVPSGLVDFLDLGSARRIVDVGCGSGKFTSYLLGQAPPGAVAIGMDIDPSVLREGQSADDVGFILAAAEQIPILSNWADLVICRRLLMNLPRPSAALEEMVRTAKRDALVAAIEPDFLAERGHSTVPGELEFLRKLLLLTSEGSDLGFGAKCVVLFKEVGLSEVDAFVHSPATIGGGDCFPTAHRERSPQRLADLVAKWRMELEPNLGRTDLEALMKEASDLDGVRDQQVRSGEYASSSSFPLWIVRGRKVIK
ncbi:MAG: class I SAM-dependent methyltransferase [Thermoplasmata archaeon]